MPAESVKPDAAVPLGPTARGIASVMLIAHLFCGLVAVSANLARSELQARLLARFAFYTQLLNMDLNYTPYHLTHATEDDVDHRVELLPRGAEGTDEQAWVRLPPDRFPGSESYQRYQRFAHVMSFLAAQDAQVGRLAQSVGRHFLARRQLEPQQVRVRKHMLQGRESLSGGTAQQRDPNNPIYFRQVYAANYLIGAEGQISVIKIDDVGDVALPTGQPAR